MISVILSLLLGCESMKSPSDCVDCDTASVDADTSETDDTHQDSGDTDTEDTEDTQDTTPNVDADGDGFTLEAGDCDDGSDDITTKREVNAWPHSGHRCCAPPAICSYPEPASQMREAFKRIA